MQPFTICVTILLLLGVSGSWGDVSISRPECNKSRAVTFQCRIKAALKPYKGKKIKIIYRDVFLFLITAKENTYFQVPENQILGTIFSNAGP